VSEKDRLSDARDFFRRYPGTSGGEFGFGTALIDFEMWESASGRLSKHGGSAWWRAVNGVMSLNMREAEDLLAKGQTRSDDPGVQAWMDYALLSQQDVPADVEQRAFWRAHQISLHQGTRAALNLWAREAYEDPAEGAFMNTVVKNVDEAALANAGSGSGLFGAGMLDRGVALAYPDHYPADVVDEIRAGMLSDLYNTAAGREHPNTGVMSTRWDR
jgi:hypothetical protein